MCGYFKWMLFLNLESVLWKNANSYYLHLYLYFRLKYAYRKLLVVGNCDKRPITNTKFTCIDRLFMLHF